MSKDDWVPKEYVHEMEREVVCSRCRQSSQMIEVGMHPNTHNHITYSPSFVSKCCRANPLTPETPG